jgi:nitrate/nitrite-specific signal transduction histidine kinase
MASRRETAGTYVQKVHDDTKRCLVELKSHNERLRLQVAAVDSERNRLQQEKMRLQEQLMTAREEVSMRQEEHNSLLRRLSDVEVENERVASQFLDIETQNTNLANLYVASHQLRSSLDREQILAAIKEIIINLIGSEDFGIFERIDDTDRLVLVDSFDPAPQIVHEVRLGDGIIGTVAATGEPHVSSDARNRVSGMTACIPLKVDDQVTGVIAVFRLLPQKANVLESLDHELFDLLAAQAGIALYCSKLHEMAAGRELVTSRTQ